MPDSREQVEIELRVAKHSVQVDSQRSERYYALAHKRKKGATRKARFYGAEARKGLLMVDLLEKKLSRMEVIA
jgi:hypothetical protein